MQFTFELSVRGYELDSYQHVNNAVYLQYMEQARWDIFKSSGAYDSCFEEGILLVVADLHVRYKGEARNFDELVITTKLSVEEPYLVFSHFIRKKDTNVLITKGKVKTIFIDKNRKPIDIPKSIAALID